MFHYSVKSAYEGQVLSFVLLYQSSSVTERPLRAHGTLHPQGVSARPGHDRERPHARQRVPRPRAAQTG